MKRRWPIHVGIGIAVIFLITGATLWGRMYATEAEAPVADIPIQNVAVQEIPPFTRRAMIDAINEVRSDLKLNTLQESPQLNQSAQLKANDLQTKNYWAHTAPDGTEPWVYLDQVGYPYLEAGENLAKCYESPKAVVEAWKNSPSHYAAMTGNYTDTGVGMRIHTLDCIIIVNHYGRK